MKSIGKVSCILAFVLKSSVQYNEGKKHFLDFSDFYCQTRDVSGHDQSLSRQFYGMKVEVWC